MMLNQYDGLMYCNSTAVKINKKEAPAGKWEQA
jgi:hypothetical protein